MKKAFEIVGAIVIVVAITYLIFDNKEKEKRLKKLEADNMKLLKASLEGADEMTDGMKKEIQPLIDKYERTYPHVANELKVVLDTYTHVNKEKAIGSISICLETLLVEKYRTSKRFREWIKTTKNRHYKEATQEHYVLYAFEDKVLTKQEFEFASIIRKVRNKTFHQAGFELSKRFGNAYMLIGIEITFKLGELLMQSNAT